MLTTSPSVSPSPFKRAGDAGQRADRLCPGVAVGRQAAGGGGEVADRGARPAEDDKGLARRDLDGGQDGKIGVEQRMADDTVRPRAPRCGGGRKQQERRGRRGRKGWHEHLRSILLMRVQTFYERTRD